MADEWMNTPLATVPDHFIPHEATTPRGRPRHDNPTRRVYGVSEVREMLKVIPADDRDLWLHVCLIMGRTFNRSDEAWQVCNEWADKWDGPRDRNHDKHMRHFFYEKSQQGADRELSIGTIVKLAMDHGWIPTTGRMPLEDFYFHLGEGFLYRPTMRTCPAKDVDIGVSPRMDDGVMRKASEIIQRRRLVTCVTSHPQLAEYTPDMNLIKGELIADSGAAILNVYRHATVPLGDAAKATPWVEHCQKLFNKPGDCDQFFNFMGHRAQRQWEKIRFALMIAGEQGTGKDTAIEMAVPSIGAWNVENIPPRALQTGFNAFLACALLRVNEAADAQDQSRWMLNEQLKNIIAGTPDHATINGKYQVTQYIRLYCAVIVTTNHLLASIHIPEDDRRYDVLDCASLEEMGLGDATKRKQYFLDLWDWFYGQQGAQHIAAFLHARDLSGFSAALGQRKTAAHGEVVRAGMVGDDWLRNILDGLGDPDVLRTDWILERAVGMNEVKADVRGKMAHALRRAGYEAHSNPQYRDGRWRINGVLCRVYKKRGFTVQGKWQDKLELKP